MRSKVTGFDISLEDDCGSILLHYGKTWEIEELHTHSLGLVPSSVDRKVTMIFLFQV